MLMLDLCCGLGGALYGVGLLFILLAVGLI